MEIKDREVCDIRHETKRLAKNGRYFSKRSVERLLKRKGILNKAIRQVDILDEYGSPPNRLLLDAAVTESRARRRRILFAEIRQLPSGQQCICANDPRGMRFWTTIQNRKVETIHNAIKKLQQHIGRPIAIFSTGDLTGHMRDIPSSDLIFTHPHVYQSRPLTRKIFAPFTKPPTKRRSPHLRRLEAESVFIIREAFSEAQNPAMMYSIGKDSSVLLHLARKAFFPSKAPFPLLHIDTLWKFREMYQFRDLVASESGFKLLTYSNPRLKRENINPYDHGSEFFTEVAKTEALKQALDQYDFDIIFGGARRDEEKSRAKERIFSVRSQNHTWDPKRQRPEVWDLYNTKVKTGENIRVFPLSNWTEVDIWSYILEEKIPVVPLYFAKVRPVVLEPNFISLVDDERCRIPKNQKIVLKKIRFRTLGCYPLTGAIESDAETVEEILMETIQSVRSERQGRRIDNDSRGSMEKKKREGYF